MCISQRIRHTLKEEVRVIWGKELWAPFHPVFA